MSVLEQVEKLATEKMKLEQEKKTIEESIKAIEDELKATYGDNWQTQYEQALTQLQNWEQAHV